MHLRNRCRKSRTETRLPYCAETGITEKSLGGDFRFNLMLNDNDGDGRDATIGIASDAFLSKDVLHAPIVRFAASN